MGRKQVGPMKKWVSMEPGTYIFDRIFIPNPTTSFGNSPEHNFRTKYQMWKMMGHFQI